MSKFRATYSGGEHKITGEGYSLKEAICNVIRYNITRLGFNGNHRYDLTNPNCWKFEKLVETPTWEEIVID